MIILAFINLIKLATIFVFVFATIWITRHYRSRKNETSIMTPHEQTILDDLARIADRMERRLETLEKIIEADDPKWKERI
jgi:phage shock protein B